MINKKFRRYTVSHIDLLLLYYFWIAGGYTYDIGIILLVIGTIVIGTLSVQTSHLLWLSAQGSLYSLFQPVRVVRVSSERWSVYFFRVYSKSIHCQALHRKNQYVWSSRTRYEVELVGILERLQNKIEKIREMLKGGEKSLRRDFQSIPLIYALVASNDRIINGLPGYYYSEGIQ